MLYSWANYVTTAERENFLAAARLHASETKKMKRKSYGYIHNYFTNADTQIYDDAEVSIKYIKYQLISLGFIDILHTKPECCVKDIDQDTCSYYNDGRNSHE